MPPPKLHLDEHLPPRPALQLRRLGHDVTSTLESGLEEADDDEQLAFAAAAQRAFVTCNHKDFAPRHEKYLSQDKEHWGIVLSTEETISVLRHRLLRMLNTLKEEDLKGQLRWLNEFK